MLPKKIYFKRKLQKKEIYCHKDIKILSLFILIIIIYISIKTKSNYEAILDYPIFIIDEYKKIFDFINKKKTFDLYRKKNKIETIFILISIFPFLKKEIIITKKNAIYILCKKFFNFNKKRLKINKNHLTNFSVIFKSFIFYKWETFPNRNKTNYLRHILYHYYSDECLNIYELSLNINIKYYFDKKEEKSYELLSDLMSKILFFDFILENIGSYEKKECLKSGYVSVSINYSNNIGI